MATIHYHSECRRFIGRQLPLTYKGLPEKRGEGLKRLDFDREAQRGTETARPTWVRRSSWVTACWPNVGLVVNHG
jgi:hypothetical protein